MANLQTEEIYSYAFAPFPYYYTSRCPFESIDEEAEAYRRYFISREAEPHFPRFTEMVRVERAGWNSEHAFFVGPIDDKSPRNLAVGHMLVVEGRETANPTLWPLEELIFLAFDLDLNSGSQKRDIIERVDSYLHENHLDNTVPHITIYHAKKRHSTYGERSGEYCPTAMPLEIRFARNLNANHGFGGMVTTSFILIDDAS